jgi:hypothetical protein
MQQLMMLQNAEFSATVNPNGFEKTEARGQKFYLFLLPLLFNRSDTLAWLIYRVSKSF